MYQRVQVKRGETNMGDEQLPHLVSVARIIKLPIVETGWHLAADIYARIKVNAVLIFANISPISVSKSVVLMWDSRFSTAVTRKSTVFWDVMPCCLVEFQQSFGITYCLRHKGRAKIAAYWLLGLIFETENGGTIFHRNIG
jgi:hypothetical protein